MLRRVLTIALAATVLAALPSNAQATTYDTLKDALGNTNGCTMRFAPLTFGPSNFGDYVEVASQYWLTCPESAGVGRTVVLQRVDSQDPDGSWRSFAPFEDSGWRPTYSVPQDFSTNLPTNVPCFWLVSRGLEPGTPTTIRVLLRAKTKTTQNNTDPNPFITTVARTISVTC